MTQGALTTFAVLCVRNAGQADCRKDSVRCATTTVPMTPAEMAGQLVFHVKHQAIADLETFGQMVAERNEVMNLVGPATIPHFWSRHVLDSAQLLNHRPDARTWADLGAGSRLSPSVVLAILLKHSQAT